MTTTVKNIKLSPIKQLFDLNGELTNFDLYFEISTKNIPFDVLVVTQKILDTGENLQYRNVTNGFITGNIVSDKNIYDSYFLLIKSNQECDCEIKITLKEIPPNQDFLKYQQNKILEETQKKNQLHQDIEKQPESQNKLNNKLNKLTDKKTDNTKSNLTNSGFFNWKFVLIGIILVAGCIILWKIYNLNKNKLSNNTQPPLINQGIQENIQSNFHHENKQINEQLTNILPQINTNILPQINTNILQENQINNQIPINTPETNLLNKINNIPLW
jgi:hypothetical protein